MTNVFCSENQTPSSNCPVRGGVHGKCFIKIEQYRNMVKLEDFLQVCVFGVSSAVCIDFSCRFLTVPDESTTDYDSDDVYLRNISTLRHLCLKSSRVHGARSWYVIDLHTRPIRRATIQSFCVDTRRLTVKTIQRLVLRQSKIVTAGTQ